MATPKNLLSSKPSTPDLEPVKSAKLKKFNEKEAKGVKIGVAPKRKENGGATEQKIVVDNDPYAKEKIKEWREANAAE